MFRRSALLLAALLPLAARATPSNLCTTQRCVVYASSDTDLYQVDPATLQLSHLCAFNGAVPTGTPVTDIAVAADGTVYGVTETAIYKIDPVTCATTQLAPLSTSTQKWVCLAFTAGGTLVAADTSGDVVTIDPASGAVSPAGSFNGYGCSGDIVAIDDANQTIYATATDPTCTTTSCDDLLVTLDPNNGYAATVVGHLGYRGYFGLGYWAGKLYAFTHGGLELSIDPATAAHTVIAATNPVVKFSGGATTPLAPTCTNACSNGATQCASGGLQTCQLQPDGCLDWTTSTCPSNQTCTSGACVPLCTNACTAGQTQCSGNTVQTCTQQGNGCYAWTDGQVCGSGEICANGQCTASCTDACTLGAAQCSGSFAQSCVSGVSGCTEWQNAADCGAPGCSGGSCCACAVGDVRCDGNALETCEATGAGSCGQWVSRPCASGACYAAACLVSCDPGSEVNQCATGEQCLPFNGGDYCGSYGDGGFTPGTTTGGTTGGTSGSSGSTGGTSGSGSTSSGGSSGSTLSPTSGSSGGAGGQKKSSASTATGCGCNATSSSSVLALAFGLLVLGSRRRRG